MIPQSLAPSPLSLYIHIPFCKKKCLYCDFVSYAGKEDLIDDYVEALCKEIKELGTGDWGLATVFFGGGTPTLLEPKHFDKIISTLISHSALVISHSEISVESNPGTADKTKLKALRELGLSRLSIGVQSFNDRHLNTLGRIHSANEAITFYRSARSAGFNNINLDLMFALPGQTLEEWKADLKTAIDLQPNHLSTYNLQIEEGTPFWNSYHSLVPSPRYPAPNEDEELAMYEYTIDTLTAAGYKHYEISNFAKPGYECRHNINYWKNGNYFGIGAGAHSHGNGRRWSNPNCVETYILSWKPEAERLGFQKYPETAKFIRRFSGIPDQRETLFLGLRLLDGVRKENFNGFEKEVNELLKDGMLEEKSGNYRLTRKGLYLGNLVFEKFV